MTGLIGIGLGACGAVPPADTDSNGANADSNARSSVIDPARWAAPPLEFATSVRDGRTGERIGFEAFLDRLATADAVFLGETHTDETTHRVELAVYRGMLARNGDVVLAMEMFERDDQAVLDDYLAGRIDEAAFREKAGIWSNYDTAYRPMIEHAKSIGASVVASNFPTPLRRRIFSEGADFMNALEGDEARLVPAELIPNTPSYWRRVDNAIRGHIGMMGTRDENDQRLTSTQTLWDNSMGESCALALDAHPGSTVVHVNGGFHSAYFDGTVRQFSLRRPSADVLTVAIVPSRNPSVATADGLPVADFVVFASQRSVDYNDGSWSLYTERELEYRLHVPEQATPDARVPLLIWLPQDGLTAEDGMRLWKTRLGEHAAIAVIEPPYRETQEDLMVGGRWFWPDSFAEDISLLGQAIEDVWGFVARYYPVDAERTALAGEGAGATVAATVSLLDGTIGVNGVAFGPRGYRKIRDIPLPLPELDGDLVPPARSLRLFVGEGDEDWWGEELEQYATIDFDATMARADASPWTRERSQDDALRTALGFESIDALTFDRRAVSVDGESARETYWARLLALKHTQETGSVVPVLTREEVEGSSLTLLDLTMRAADFAEGDALPACPGPFGGTTVVVLAATTPSEDVDAWLELEESDPLTARSRFLRTRIAVGIEGERSLANVLTKLRGERRTNVLVVAGEFCATGDTMRALSRSVESLADSMTLHWMPGLGRDL